MDGSWRVGFRPETVAWQEPDADLMRLGVMDRPLS